MLAVHIGAAVGLAAGEVQTVYCTYDPESRSGECQRKVKGTLHWVSAADAIPAEVRLYEPLMTSEIADKEDFVNQLNPNSLTIRQALVEPDLANEKPGDKSQFMRIGYFAADLDHTPEKPVFNRVVGLKDSFKA